MSRMLSVNREQSWAAEPKQFGDPTLRRLQNRVVDITVDSTQESRGSKGGTRDVLLTLIKGMFSRNLALHRDATAFGG
jgi:hypothetical protein